jgi:hypothetical protein
VFEERPVRPAHKGIRGLPDGSRRSTHGAVFSPPGWSVFWILVRS